MITAAAAIMITVFASFALSGDHVLQLFGIGLATAILLDALVIRMVLLPATLAVLGSGHLVAPALARSAAAPPGRRASTLTLPSPTDSR